jgi:molybdopterin-guanine dinucleotide biosynthesis protein A
MSLRVGPRPLAAAAVIAGGPATRMGGASKAALLIDGESIASRQTRALRAVFGRVVVVAGDPGPWGELGVERVADHHRGAGPLAGIHAALRATEVHPGVVCVAGDMPFLSDGLLRLLRDRDPDADAVVPRVQGRVEPLLARYGRGCLPVIEARLAAGDRALHSLLDDLAVSWIEEGELRAFDPHLRGLVNVNTPEDLARARRGPLRGR